MGDEARTEALTEPAKIGNGETARTGLLAATKNDGRAAETCTDPGDNGPLNPTGPLATPAWTDWGGDATKLGRPEPGACR